MRQRLSLCTGPRALNLIFGMASSVTATIVQMGVPQIDRIAPEEGRHMKDGGPRAAVSGEGCFGRRSAPMTKRSRMSISTVSSSLEVRSCCRN